MRRNVMAFFSTIVALFFVASVVLPVAAESDITQAKQSSTKRVQFYLNKMNTVPPADILNQISFSGQGGGPDCRENSYPRPSFYYGSSSSSETGNLELMVPHYALTCGWKKNEKITGSVKYPNGYKRNIAVDQFTTNGFYAASITFAPTLDDPVGKYTITMTGSQHSVQSVINYSMPKGLRLYNISSSIILLHGFQPYENIRVFIYSNLGSRLKGWQEFSVGSNGRLEVEFIPSLKNADIVAVVGAKSGEVGYRGADSVIKKNTQTHCAGGLPSRVKVGSQARAAYTDGSNLRIRVKPGFSQDYNYRVSEGTKMKIVNGPKCADGSTWWEVEISGGIKGWVAEYWNGREYLIEPFP